MNMAGMEHLHTLRGRWMDNEPMSRHVSWRAGGVARRAYLPADLDDLVSMMRTLSSAFTVIQMLGSKVPAARSDVAGPIGRYAPIIRPPPAAVAVLMKVRRERRADRVMSPLPRYARAARRIARLMR